MSDMIAKVRERADREFLNLLRKLLDDPAEVAKLSPNRLAYVKLAVEAFDWWIATGRTSGVPDDHSVQAGFPAGSLAPRDNIILAFVREHPESHEGLESARKAIMEQRERMGSSRN